MNPVILNSPLPGCGFIPCANVQTALFYVEQVKQGQELAWYTDSENWKAARWFVVIPDINVN